MMMGTTASLHVTPTHEASYRSICENGIFPPEVVDTQPTHREVHVILDNFSTHKTNLVKQFLADDPNATLHFTPTYSSWLESGRELVQQTAT
jgi:hypothetical protein